MLNTYKLDTSDLKSVPSNLPESIKNIIYVEKQGHTIIPIAPSSD